MKTKNLLTSIAGVAVLFLYYTGAHAVSVGTPIFSKSTYERFEKAQASFTIGKTYTNPYDPDEVMVDAEITIPGGTVEIVPCFYYVPCAFVPGSNANYNENTGQAKWMLRYSPRHHSAGTYSVRIKVTEAGGVISYSSSSSFNMITGSRKGFIRLDQNNPQFTRFDNGQPYLPVGENVCWNDHSLATFFNNYLPKLSANNANWTRYWLCDFLRQALEWKTGHWSSWYSGLGKYSQKASALLDTVLVMCENNGVYMQLVFQHHGQFSTTVNAEWNDNPYNTANGGFLNNAGEFFTNSNARKQAKEQYRYIVARWGYSCNILSWELFNEVNFTDGTEANIDSWANEIGNYIKTIDVFNHIVNISGNNYLATFDKNSGLDQLQYHEYANSIETVTYKNLTQFKNSFTKPIWCGEFGVPGTYDASIPNDTEADHIRKTFWMNMMNGTPASFWYWDWIELKNFYAVTFKSLGAYLKGEDILKSTGGNASTFTILNSETTGNLTVSPGNSSWNSTNVPNPWIDTLTGDGEFLKLPELSAYLQGSWQSNRNRDIRFAVKFENNASVDMNISEISSSGTKIVEVFIDGNSYNNYTLTSAPYTITVNGIPAGLHSIRFYNTGQDWVRIKDFKFSQVKYDKCKGYGIKGDTAAFVYINDKSYGEWAPSSSVNNVVNAKLHIGPFTSGNYSITYYDPKDASFVQSGGITGTLNDSLLITIPAFKKDIALKIRMENTNQIQPVITGHSLPDICLFPNPAKEFITISSRDKIQILTITTIEGQKIKNIRADNNNVHINLSELPAGIFVLIAYLDNGEVVRKKLVVR